MDLGGGVANRWEARGAEGRPKEAEAQVLETMVETEVGSGGGPGPGLCRTSPARAESGRSRGRRLRVQTLALFTMVEPSPPTSSISILPKGRLQATLPAPHPPGPRLVPGDYKIQRQRRGHRKGCRASGKPLFPAKSMVHGPCPSSDFLSYEKTFLTV